jgi:hypothetical protein
MPFNVCYWYSSLTNEILLLRNKYIEVNALFVNRLDSRLRGNDVSNIACHSREGGNPGVHTAIN